MNYIRVYEEFIKDRRAKEPTLTGYTEKHHILPRSFGGGDEPENLIALTPEDHFFAHLLLAKIHGGQMWSPVAFMVGGNRKDYKPIISRKAFGWVKRALARSKMREGAYQFDARIHHLEHKDGREWSGHQIDMAEHLGVSKAAACRLVNGKDGSASGWFIRGQRPKRMGRGSVGGSAHHMYKSDVFKFRHVDGRIFNGTQHDLHVSLGVSKSMVNRLCRGEFRCAKGWYIDGRPPAKTGRGAAHKIEPFSLERGGRVLTGDRVELAKALKTTPESVSQGLYNLRRGKVKTYKGWTLASQEKQIATQYRLV